MRKIVICLLLQVFIAMIIYSGCKLSIEDDELETAVTPDVKASGTVINVFLAKTNIQASYINVYRRKAGTDDSVNIGLLFPANVEPVNFTYTFCDELVIKDQNYQYSARYCINGKYIYSGWSSSVKSNESTYTNEDELKYTIASGGQFTYSASNNTLTFSADVNEPAKPSAGYFTAKLGVLSKQTSNVYDINNLVTSNKIAEDSTIQLATLLPASLFDTPLTIAGIVGQREEKVGSKTKYVHWTEPLVLKIDGKAPAAKQITISSGSGSGYDYSRNVIVVVE